VKPRDVLLAVLSPLLDLKDKEDVVLLRVIVGGIKNGKKTVLEYETATFKDRKNSVTAMARTTANTISVVAQMIGSGVIQKRGVYPPEQIVPGDIYIKEMEKRGVVIKEKQYVKE
jgi:lysine 6-dehydrogenase